MLLTIHFPIARTSIPYNFYLGELGEYCQLHILEKDYIKLSVTLFISIAICLRLFSEDGHCKTRCLTLSGEAMSHRGYVLEKGGNLLSLISSVLSKLAWQTRWAIISHRLMTADYLSDRAHHVRYLGLGLTILSISKDFCI